MEEEHSRQTGQNVQAHCAGREHGTLMFKDLKEG